MFNFLSMVDNYEDRLVDNFTQGDLVVDTAAVTDSKQPYETGIEHPKYNGGELVIVELYDTKEEAQVGHDKWVKIMTAKKLPKELKNVSSCEIAEAIDSLNGNDGWRTIGKIT